MSGEWGGWWELFVKIKNFYFNEFQFKFQINTYTHTLLIQSLN